MFRPHRLLLVLSPLAALAFSACGSNDATTGATSTPAATAAPAASPGPTTASGDPYVFTMVGPLTGDNAVYGQNLKKGVDLAAAQINAGGGIGGRPVEIKTEDDQCDPTQAATVASRIASDDAVFAVIGHVCSSATLAALPVYKRAGLSAVSPSSTSPSLTKQAYDNFARIIPDDNTQAGQAADLAVKTLAKKRIAILFSSDDYGQGLDERAKAAVPEAGGEVVANETYTPTTTKDFTPQLTKIAQGKPDAILLLGYYNDMGTAVSQLPRVGLDGVTLVAAAGVAQADYAKLGGKQAEGTYLLSYYDPASPLPANETFVKEFKAKYGDDPAEQAAYGYEVPFILKKAIEGGATKDDLITRVRGLTFDGPTGTSTFDPANGNVVGKSGVVLRVKAGKLTLDPALTAQVNGAQG